jgi:hypothetical protein
MLKGQGGLRSLEKFNDSTEASIREVDRAHQSKEGSKAAELTLYKLIDIDRVSYSVVNDVDRDVKLSKLSESNVTAVKLSELET